MRGATVGEAREGEVHGGVLVEEWRGRWEE